MKKILAICMILCVMLCLMPGMASAQNASGCHGLQAQTPLDGSAKKLDTAGAVFLYELNTDTLVYAYNPDKQVNPTGMVKLLTVLVALEKGNLEDVATVYRATLDTVAIGAVSAGLKAGEEIPLRDLLYCVMVSSANDAAAVIASHIGGSQAGFVEMMNQKAQELGCTASCFTNPHGLNEPGQYSTARDLAIITRAALDNPLFVEMFALTEYTVPATNLSGERKLRTTNYMMSDDYVRGELDSRVTGGKPAAATTKDRSMICTAEVGMKRYLCVVMNVKAEVSQDGLSVIRFGIFQEMKSLLNYAFQNMQVVQLADDAQALYQYPVSGGANAVVLRPGKDLSVVLPVNYDPSLLKYDHILDSGLLAAPITQGQKLGSLQISYGDMFLGSCDLLAMHDVVSEGSQIQTGDRIDVIHTDQPDPYKELMILGALVLTAGFVVFLLIKLVIRWVRNADIRRMQRKRARNRKRGRQI